MTEDDKHWRWASAPAGPGAAPAAHIPSPPPSQAAPAAASPLSSATASATAVPVLTARGRWRAALADRLPPTLQGRWGLDRTTGIVLAVSVLLGALLIGGWAVLRSSPHELAISRVHSSGSESAGDAAPNGFARDAPEEPIGSADARPVPALGLGGPPGTATGAGVVVDIEGKVARPGVRMLPDGARVIDALSAAGGALPGTDLSALDQARPLADGEQILVGVAPPPGAAGPAPGRGGKGRLRAGTAQIEPVRLNSAGVEDLEELPGIGPALAQRVVDYRTENGPFRSVEDLKQVSGFGGQRYLAIAPSLTL